MKILSFLKMLTVKQWIITGAVVTVAAASVATGIAVKNNDIAEEPSSVIQTTIESTTEESTTDVTETTTESSAIEESSTRESDVESTTKKKDKNTKATETTVKNNSIIDENGNIYIHGTNGDGFVRTEPDFEYVSKITTYDGQVYYKVYDEAKNEYLYKDLYGTGYSETYVLDKIRPTEAEIKANPISKVTLNGVTWYKYKTGSGTRYLSSDGRDETGIQLGIPTNGEESITVSGVTFYKTYDEGFGYRYYDSNGNCLQYDGSYCSQCGDGNCNQSMTSYICVICNEEIAAFECHPSSHYDASH